MLTSLPRGMPSGHADGCALPKAMAASVISSSFVTLPSSLQSPMQRGAVDVGLGVTLGVGVALASSVVVGVCVDV